MASDYIYLDFNVYEIIQYKNRTSVSSARPLTEEFCSDIKDVLVEEYLLNHIIRLQDKELAAYLVLKYDMHQLTEEEKHCLHNDGHRWYNIKEWRRA